MLNRQRETGISNPGTKDLAELMFRHLDPDRIPGKINVITDTSDFYRVEYNDILMLEGNPYLMRNYEREGRFSIEEQPKFWVRRAIDLLTGEMKIVKMVFHETFKTRIGNLKFDCVRSAKKEARVLDIVKNHHHFMHGFSAKDSAGNIVRIINFIPGITIDSFISGFREDHEKYFYTVFPIVLDEFIRLVTAINFLHMNGEKHGDIRRDHVIRDKNTGTFRWIDFDCNYWHKENMFGYDLFGLGNILVYLVGQRDIIYHDLKKHNSPLLDRLSFQDMNMIYSNRIVNLKKIYPYIPDLLNLILLHFSAGANVFYDDTSQLIDDLRELQGLMNIRAIGGDVNDCTKHPTDTHCEGQTRSYCTG